MRSRRLPRTIAAFAFCSSALLLGEPSLRAQSVWSQRFPANVLAPRAGHGLAFDEQRQVAVLFGGCDSIQCFGDTWTWDGSNWTQVATAGPSPRNGFGMAYDRARGRVVLFGGGDGSRLFGDTWEWDGSAWTRIATSGGPAARWNVGMTYDPLRQRVVMVGGSTFTKAFRQTWEWDGATWTLVSVVGPSPRVSPGLAFDGNLGAVLLYGGVDIYANPPFPGDTWAWDGSAWSQVAVSGGPVHPESGFSGLPNLGFYAMSMVWDPAVQRVVLLGGTIGLPPVFTGASSSLTWEWDGTAWLLRREAGLQPRSWAAATYDPLRETVLVHGGNDYSYYMPGGVSSSYLADTWEYAPVNPARTQAVGTACAGTAGVPLLEEPSGRRAWIGEPFDLALSGLPPAGGACVLTLGVSQSVFGGVPLPISLAPLGAPGCALWSSAEFAVPAQNTGGSAILPLPIPANPLLVGQAFYAQGLAVDAANPLGLIASGSLQITIGSR
jgi:hypothetical protein